MKTVGLPNELSCFLQLGFAFVITLTPVRSFLGGIYGYKTLRLTSAVSRDVLLPVLWLFLDKYKLGLHY